MTKLQSIIMLLDKISEIAPRGTRIDVKMDEKYWDSLRRAIDNKKRQHINFYEKDIDIKFIPITVMQTKTIGEAIQKRIHER